MNPIIPQKRSADTQIDRPSTRRNLGYRPPTVSFDLTPESSDLPPSTITMTPLALVGEEYNDQTMVNLANRLHREVIRVLQQYYITFSTERIQNIRGTLMMYNNENQEHTHTVNLHVGDINYEAFSLSFERATGAGSNPNLRIEDVSWKFWINPASLQVGGSKKFTNPKKWEGINSWDKKLKRIKQVDTTKIGCAAIALADTIEIKEKKFQNRYNSNGFTLFTKALQDKMQFKNPLKVSIIELSRILDFYPEYR